MKRGHVLLSIVTFMGVGLLLVAVFATRFATTLSSRRADAARGQALWLARSACSAGVSGKLEVRTADGVAVVTRQGATVTAALPSLTAEVNCQSGLERIAR